MPFIHERAYLPCHTGATRLRSGWRGRLILQVELEDGSWHDAAEWELKKIGFAASSEYRRRTPDAPPRDWPHYLTAGVTQFKWE